jgi:hypothetical protein
MQVGEESPERKAKTTMISIESSIDQVRKEMPNVAGYFRNSKNNETIDYF